VALVKGQNSTMHKGTHEHHPIYSSLTHTPLLSYICEYHTPTWHWQNFASHLLLCMLFSGTSGNYVRAAWNRAKNRMRLASRGLATPVICGWKQCSMYTYL